MSIRFQSLRGVCRWRPGIETRFDQFFALRSPKLPISKSISTVEPPQKVNIRRILTYEHDPPERVNAREEHRERPKIRFVESASKTQGTYQISRDTYGEGWITFHARKIRGSYSFLFLRDACTCHKCVDPSTKQRKFATHDLDLNIELKDLSLGDYKVTIQWESGSAESPELHQSEYTYSQLQKLNLRPPPLSIRAGLTRTPWDQATFARNQHWLSFDEYMKDDEKFKLFLRSLYRYGLVFVKDVPEAEDSVSQIATRMGPLRNSFYGSTWDVRSVVDAKNVAYTNQYLGFHMDLLYMANPPGYQLLHCMSNSLPGGESMFSDTFRAAEQLSAADPTAHRRLCQQHVPYGYHNDGQSYYNRHPVIERSGRHFLRVNYSPPFQDTHPSAVGSSFAGPFVKSMRKFADYLEDPDGVFELKLKPGECVIFANRRVVHARKAFDMSLSDGKKHSRWLRGAYVDEEALMSKFQILREEDPLAWDKMTPDQRM